MKRLLAILLILTFISSFAANTAAESADSDAAALADDRVIPSPLVFDSALEEALARTKGTVTPLPVYIDLSIDPLLMQDMPSWPDFTAAEQEYYAAEHEQYRQYEAALDDIREAIGSENISHISGVCYDALTAMVTNTEIPALMADEHIRQVSYWDPDAVNRRGSEEYDPGRRGIRWRDRLVAQSQDICFEDKSTRAPLNSYEELYYHNSALKDEPFVCDWALVRAECTCIICCVIYSDVVGGRRLWAPGWKLQPFTFDIGLYDAQQNRFYDLTDIDFDDYDELYEVFRSLDLGNRTDPEHWDACFPLGDVDSDYAVTVLDATRIQRVLAGLESKYGIVTAEADADADGMITILDATRIQRSIAGL